MSIFRRREVLDCRSWRLINQRFKILLGYLNLRGEVCSLTVWAAIGAVGFVVLGGEVVRLFLVATAKVGFAGAASFEGGDDSFLVHCRSTLKSLFTPLAVRGSVGGCQQL